MQFFGRNFLFSLIYFFLFCFSIFAEDDKSNTSESDESNELFSENTTKEEKEWLRPIIFIRDILDDKYPFRIDFGAEPHRHGSLVFGAVDYDWSDNFSQRIRFEYDHYSTSTNSSGSLSNQEVLSVTVTQFPIVFFFGNSNVNALSRFAQLNIGLYISYSKTFTDTGAFFSFENTEENRDFFDFDTDFSQDTFISGFFITNSTQIYKIIGPAFGYSINIPFHKYVSATIEGFFVPAFLVTMSTESDNTYYFDSTIKTTSNSVDFRSLSYPIARQTLGLDFFRYIRLKAQMTYQHLDLRAITIGDVAIENYSLHTITLRYGGELLNPPKTRKKSAHLWAGLYYEMNWNKSYLQDLSLTEYTGKWILCFGT